MRTIGFKDTYSIDIDGSDFDLHYTFEPGERETRMDMVEVDVSSFIDVDMDYEWMCEQILESLKD